MAEACTIEKKEKKIRPCKWEKGEKKSRNKRKKRKNIADEGREIERGKEDIKEKGEEKTNLISLWWQSLSFLAIGIWRPCFYRGNNLRPIWASLLGKGVKKGIFAKIYLSESILRLNKHLQTKFAMKNFVFKLIYEQTNRVQLFGWHRIQ